MKYFLAGIMMSICFALPAQLQVQMLNSSNATIAIDINLLEGQFQWVGNPGTTGTLFRSVQITNSFDQIIIEYQLENGGNEDYYDLSLNATIDGEQLHIYEEDIIGDIGGGLPPVSNEPRKLIWTKLMDRYLNLEGRLNVVFRAELWGKPRLPYGIDCLEKPVFGGKQLLPHYIAAGVGAGALGASFLFKSQSDDAYENGYLAQRFEEAAEPYYQDANDKHHKSLFLRYAGTAILAADAAVLIFRYFRYRKKMDAYNEYCRDGNGVSINPMYELPSDLAGSGKIGLKINYSF